MNQPYAACSMEYRPLEVIGHGSFGVIRKVRRSDGLVLARKEISYKSMNQKERTQLIAEFRILKSLVHPNIVHYLHHEHVTELQEVHLYMEYCGGGDLAGVIRRYKNTDQYYPENEVWNVLTQLVQALYRCHYNANPPAQSVSILAPQAAAAAEPLDDEPQSFVLHRDIKPENIFLDGDSKPFTNVKLGDFGLAKLLDGDNPLATTYVGTPYYMSPEVLMDRPSTPASDIWSLGCVIYELCCKHPPFQAKTHLQLSQRIQEGVFKPMPAHIYSQTLARTVSACLSLAPSQRPTAATLLKLDIIKICRKELEIKERELQLKDREHRSKGHEHQLQEREHQLKEREEELNQVYDRLQADLRDVIEQEVERRLRDRERERERDRDRDRDLDRDRDRDRERVAAEELRIRPPPMTSPLARKLLIERPGSPKRDHHPLSRAKSPVY